MTTSIIATTLIIFGCVLLLLCTLPMKNTYDGKTLTVQFVLGKEVIDMKEAKFLPVPEDATHHIIRIGGTSIGKKHSGNFMNTKTRTRYKFYLTGKGEKVYFEIGDKKYLVDDITI